MARTGGQGVTSEWRRGFFDGNRDKAYHLPIFNVRKRRSVDMFVT